MRAFLAALWLLVVVIAAQAAGGRQSAKEANDATLTDGPGMGGRGSPALATPPLAAHVALRGSAAWCAPTATRCQGWGGHVLLGAVRSFRWGDRPYRVTVWAGSRHVTVTIVSYCACGRGTVIDLSPYSFAKLAPLSAGLVRVRVLR